MLTLLKSIAFIFIAVSCFIVLTKFILEYQRLDYIHKKNVKEIEERRKNMKIKCTICGEPVSSVELPEGTVIKAFIECTKCIEKKYKEKDESKSDMIIGGLDLLKKI